jgi:hypothetical protein
LVIAFGTLWLQSQQFRKSEEDSQWREAMKVVSFNNPSQALASAIWMESFLDSPTRAHRDLSRHVAASLLPRVDNVAGLDDVVADLIAHTDANNQLDIISLARKVYTDQWQRYGLTPSDPIELRSATEEVIGGLDDAKEVGARKVDAAAFSAGTWEIDSASQALWEIWVRQKLASPKEKNLGDIVLEGTKRGKAFSVDFTDADLTNAVLSNVSLQGANLTRADLSKLTILDGVNLSAITHFNGSKWNDVDWWDAQIISPELCAYLQVKFPPPPRAKLPEGCRP